ncbi:NADP-dependent oxidoreductase domain containing protein [Rhypophila decipiens]
MATSQESPKPGAMPMMIYGTAWKKDKTAELVYEAIKAGFRGVDSGVGEHYNEPGVGEGLGRAFDEGLVKRKDLWIQTKISSLDDGRFPDRDMKARWPHLEPRIGRIIASVLESLDDLFPSSSSSSSSPSEENQESSYIDSLLLHETHAYQPADILTMIDILKHLSLLPQRIRSLGVCNTTQSQLKSLEKAGIIPFVVQNPFSMYGADEFDAPVRKWCRSKNHTPINNTSSRPDQNPEILLLQCTTNSDNNNQKHHNVAVAYQAFHTLTSNKPIWANAPYTERLSSLINVPRPVVWYSLLISAGIVVLNGTSTPRRMKGDIDGLKSVWRWRDSDDKNREIWDRCRRVFLDAIDVDNTDEEEEETA